MFSTVTAEPQALLDLGHDAYFPAEQRTEQLVRWRCEVIDLRARADAALRDPGPRWALVRVGGAIRLGVGGADGGVRVRRAVDSDTGDRLLLRLLPAAPAHGAAVLRQAARMRALAHPALVALRSAAWDGAAAAVCSVWEHHGGRTVEALLTRGRGPMRLCDVPGLARQATAGLAYLHRHRVLHGNLQVRRGPPPE